MSDDPYAGTFDEEINKPPDESKIPADTMQIIRDGLAYDAGARTLLSVVLVLKNRAGFTVDDILALFEKYPDGIAKKYQSRLRDEVERAYYAVPALPSYFIEELEKQRVEPVDWLVEDFIPANTLTGFFR